MPYKPKAVAWHLHAFTSTSQCEASHKNGLPNECSAFLSSKSSLQVHLLEITANVKEVKNGFKLVFAFTFLNTQKAQILKRCRSRQINQSVQWPLTQKYSPHSSNWRLLAVMSERPRIARVSAAQKVPFPLSSLCVEKNATGAEK